MSYTEDRNTLALIRAGFVAPSSYSHIAVDFTFRRAPPDIMNVAINQPVQLIITQRQNEDYIPPKLGAFSGSGNRLGAPAAEAHPTAAMPGAFPQASSSSRPAPAVDPERVTTRFEVDQTKPMTSVQVRLADGTRLVSCPLGSLQ